MSGSQTVLTGVLENTRFGPFSNLHAFIWLVKVYRFGECLGWISSPIYIFSLSRVFARLEMGHTRDFGVGISNYAYWAFQRCYIWPSLKSTHVYFTCGNLSIWRVFGLDIVAHLYFFSLACFRAFKDVPHSRLRCRHLKLCLLGFSKMLDLAVSQIYTRVFYLWKCIDLDSVWIGDSHPYQLSFLS